MSRLKLVLMIFIAFFSSKAQAGFFVCNDTGVPLFVAAGWKQDGQWVSRGWYKIEPRDCALPIEGYLQNRNVYVRAEGGDLIFAGGQNSADFCTSSEKFFLSDGPNCEKESFLHVDIGESDAYTLNLFEPQLSPEDAALECYSPGTGRDEFASCWIRQMSTAKQRQILDCYNSNRSTAGFAICSAQGHLNADEARVAACAEDYAETRTTVTFVNCVARETLDEDEAEFVNCAIRHGGRASEIASCAIGGRLSPKERVQFQCIADNFNNYTQAGLCLLGTRMSSRDARILRCVTQNASSYVAMGICAAAGSRLTPEQQIFVGCMASTGGEPYSFAGCFAGQLTVNELNKCLSQGIGGNGCFGDNNFIVKSVRNAWKDVTEGPGPNNDLVGRDGFVMRTMENVADDVLHGPGENNDLVGRKGWLRTRLGI